MRRIWTGALVALGGLAAPQAKALVGAVSEDTSFAAQTLMLLNSSRGAAGFCSAVVVARDALLTAAHCVAATRALAVHFREGDVPVIKAVRAVAVHPGYRANAIRTRERSIDLALVRLSEPLPPRFRAVAMAHDANPAMGERFNIVGFGLSREGDGRTGGVLRSGELAVQAPLSNLLLWASDPHHKGVGACVGDSGGPIFSAANELVAITSWSTGQRGKHCGAITQGVLVAPQRGWIDSVLGDWR